MIEEVIDDSIRVVKDVSGDESLILSSIYTLIDPKKVYRCVKNGTPIKFDEYYLYIWVTLHEIQLTPINDLTEYEFDDAIIGFRIIEKLEHAFNIKFVS